MVKKLTDERLQMITDLIASSQSKTAELVGELVTEIHRLRCKVDFLVEKAKKTNNYDPEDEFHA